MRDTIYRDDAIKELRLEYSTMMPLFKDARKEWSIRTEGYRKAEEVIMKLPSADRPQGEWIYGEHDVAMCDGYRCDRCGFFVPWDYEHKFIDFINDYHFCPQCGARMKGAKDDAI